MAFSASDAAVEGFQLARREPRTILAWSLVHLIFAIAANVATLPFIQPLMALQAEQAGGPLSTAQIMGAMEPMLGFLGAMIPIELAVVSLLSAAVYRAVLRPEDKGLARLRLGGDELRLAILWIELGLLFWVAGAALLVGLSVLSIPLAVVLKGSATGAVFTVFVTFAAVLAVLTWLAVRFSLAGPMTFATRRVHIFSAWRLTQGRGWQLFSCYLLTFVFVMMIVLVELSVAAILILVISGGSVTHAAGRMGHSDYGSLQALLSPAGIVELLLNALAGGLLWAVAFAPAAVIYRELGGSLSPER